jgi:hypothetical protein
MHAVDRTRATAHSPRNEHRTARASGARCKRASQARSAITRDSFVRERQGEQYDEQGARENAGRAPASAPSQKLGYELPCIQRTLPIADRHSLPRSDDAA